MTNNIDQTFIEEKWYHPVNKTEAAVFANELLNEQVKVVTKYGKIFEGIIENTNARNLYLLTPLFRSNDLNNYEQKPNYDSSNFGFLSALFSKPEPFAQIIIPLIYVTAYGAKVNKDKTP
ncbi:MULTISPECIES: hypothetical protein [Bacillaceae]|uniref:hypothetical protein n=1 Tax=Bacillaceae TaxID=186817 RepID=UPI001BDF2AF5|nr:MULTISPECIES: hypothetical protein [Bacillaceae]MDX8362047.1 hypothetical protein [Cytobacillus sp. IB215316]